MDHFVTILPYYSLCKMSKNGNTSPLFKILLFKNVWIYLRLIFFALYGGYREYRVGDFTCFSYVWSETCTWLTAAEDAILGFNAFYRWFRAEVTARKDFSLAFVAFYHWFCACSETVEAHLLLNFLVFDRIRTPVTVEADILSSLIVFYNWFCKRATAEAYFLGSCRKYISSLISYVSCWRSTKIFLFFSLSISTLKFYEQLAAGADVLG